MYGGNTPPVEEYFSTPLVIRGVSPGENFFTIGILRKSTSKYAKLMVEPYICDILRQIYQFFHFYQKILKEK